MPLAIPVATVEKLTAIEDPVAYTLAVMDMVKPDDIILPLNRVLCAVYLQYGKTKGGILKPDSVKDEDIWQQKVALVLKVGPTAFRSSGEFDWGSDPIKPGDWVTFKVGNASQIEINRMPCRIIMDHFIETCVPDPRMITS